VDELGGKMHIFSGKSDKLLFTRFSGDKDRYFIFERQDGLAIFF
jgi:hypothetical protein